MDVPAAGGFKEAGDDVTLAGDFLFAYRADPFAFNIGRKAVGASEDLHELVALARSDA